MSYRATLNRIKGIRVFWVDCQIAVLNREIGVSLIEKLTLEPRFEGRNGVSCSAVWGEWCSKGREESAQNRGQNQHLLVRMQLWLWVGDGALVRRGQKGWGGAAQWLRWEIPAGFLSTCSGLGNLWGLIVYDNIIWLFHLSSLLECALECSEAAWYCSSMNWEEARRIPLSPLRKTFKPFAEV